MILICCAARVIYFHVVVGAGTPGTSFLHAPEVALFKIKVIIYRTVQAREYI